MLAQKFSAATTCSRPPPPAAAEGAPERPQPAIAIAIATRANVALTAYLAAL